MNIRNIITAFCALLVFFVISIFCPNKIFACTYESTINDNLLEFRITSDLDKLAVVQYLPTGGSGQKVVELFSPDIGVPWNYYSDGSTPSCWMFNGNGALACNQLNSNGAYWSNEYPSGYYHLLPGGIYGIKFDVPPQVEDIKIEYGILPGTYSPDNWSFCTRTGEIAYPAPVTKTVFAPGIMGSWNADAILGCQTDTDTEWVLAPYAEDIYQPAIDAIGESGWTTLAFCYDWRKNVSQNSDKLANFINQNTSSDEKVNFVGHSMGGLIGRGYLEASEGGKLASLLAVGAPNRGSAYAYPPWEGGDVWSNSLVEKIALTLYLKHCGKIFSNDKETIQSNVPSVKDLLPIDPYLQNSKTQEIYLPQNLNNQNTWLSNLSEKTNPWNVKLGYIAGTGVDTLKTIQTKDPNKKDYKSNIWEDGKPAGKRITTEGDGTVLLSSAILPNTPEEYKYEINENHRGLVSSSIGMARILEFLGQPENVQSAPSLANSYTDSDSALIIIGYPANFIVTDKNGQTKRAKDGMVAFMNPKNGSYKIELLPKSNSTLFIVAQFLPNGEVKYKEYNFKGVEPKFKNLKFSLENPQEDILTN